jgi:hypothetical protein
MIAVNNRTIILGVFYFMIFLHSSCNESNFDAGNKKELTNDTLNLETSNDDHLVNTSEESNNEMSPSENREIDHDTRIADILHTSKTDLKYEKNPEQQRATTIKAEEFVRSFMKSFKRDPKPFFDKAQYLDIPWTRVDFLGTKQYNVLLVSIDLITLGRFTPRYYNNVRTIKPIVEVAVTVEYELDSIYEYAGGQCVSGTFQNKENIVLVDNGDDDFKLISWTNINMVGTNLTDCANMSDEWEPYERQVYQIIDYPLASRRW